MVRLARRLRLTAQLPAVAKSPVAALILEPGDDLGVDRRGRETRVQVGADRHRLQAVPAQDLRRLPAHLDVGHLLEGQRAARRLGEDVQALELADVLPVGGD